MEALFRPARADEIAAVFSLYQKRVDWMDAVGIRQWNTTDYLTVYPAEYYWEHQQAGRLFVLETADGSIAGAVVMLEADERWPEYADGEAYYVHNLVTAPAAAGAGSFLLEQAEQQALRAGKRFVRLDCDVNNTFLNRYYESRGYVPAGKCQDGPYFGNRKEKRLK